MNNTMKAKQFLQLFVPPIYHEVKKKCITKRQPQLIPIPMRERIGEKMIVIGNGPSMKNTVEKYLDVLQTTECMMVNESCMTPIYEAVRPTVYFLVDPVYFDEENNKHYLQTRLAVLDALILKTMWPMSIIMPNRARGCYMTEKFKENPNLTVLYYAENWQLPQGLTQYEAWDKNLITPPGQTVLNTAVWLSIYWGYKETYLVGADTSWHAELKMDQETNILYTIDTHYYDNKEVYGDFYDEVNMRRPIGTKLHEELFAEATALQSYVDLKGYADWKGVKVYNASEFSWIDAFERKKLDDLK